MLVGIARIHGEIAQPCPVLRDLRRVVSDRLVNMVRLVLQKFRPFYGQSSFLEDVSAEIANSKKLGNDPFGS